MPDVEDLDDQSLIGLWSAVADRDNLTEYEEEVIAEIKRRGLDF